MAAAVPLTNSRESAIKEILEKTGAAFTNIGETAKTAISGTVSSIATPDTANYFLKVLFYLLMYAFVIFLVLLLVHFTVKPIFRFVPGGKGIIGVPGTSDDVVYWNDRKQPLPKAMAPLSSDDLAQYPFSNNFTFSIDLYVRKVPETDEKKRIILIKSDKYTTSGSDTQKTLFDTADDAEIETYFNGKASMVMYLTNTNNLVVTFFSKKSESDTTVIPYASRPIQNIPLYTPFRITVVAEERLFTLYLNGKQVFQRITNAGLYSNDEQRFFSPPSWATTPKQTIFLQNLHIWPRPISVTEVAQALPALAAAEDFDMPAEPGSLSCL